MYKANMQRLCAGVHFFLVLITKYFFHFSCCYLVEVSKLLLLFEAFLSATGSTSLGEKS